MTVQEMAEKYYPRLWNLNRLKNLVAAGRLTEEDYKEITSKHA